MIRCLLLVGLSMTLLGMSCPGNALTCANDLDGSEFGFTLTVPSKFVCASTFPNPFSLGQVRYLQSSTGFAVSVQVNSPSTEEDDGVTVEDLADLTTANGITFERKKVVVTALSSFSYVGGTNLPSGDYLFVTAVGQSDDASLGITLATILESVQFITTGE